MSKASARFSAKPTKLYCSLCKAESASSAYPFYLPSADGSYRYPRYEFYARHFNQTVKALGIAPHHSHDCRKTFVTHAKEAGVDEYAIKRLVGHRIQDLTERVYTDRSIEWLRTELEKIP